MAATATKWGPKNASGLAIYLSIALVWSVALWMLFRQSLASQEFFGSSSHYLPFGGGSIFGPSDRPLILYAYKETENARQNLEFFVKQGLHGAADFIFILNGETDAAQWIPEADNIEVIERPNVCFDLGAYGEVLREDDLWKRYKRFITLNASIRGPFIPWYSDTCWSDAYLGRVTDETKLVGMTVNCGPRPHLQSMIWATDSVGMELMLYPPKNASIPDQFGSEEDSVAYGGCYQEFLKAVHAEVGATTLMQGAGYGVEAVMAAAENASYIEHCEWPDDPSYQGAYFGTTLHPYDTIFIKANRNIDPEMINLYTEIHKSRTTGRSYELCK